MTAQLTQTFVRLMQAVTDGDSDEDINKTMVCMTGELLRTLPHIILLAAFGLA